MKDCWACHLARGNLQQHLTQWFYLGIDGIVVEDKNQKEYTMRLLYVPLEHLPCGQESTEMRQNAERLLNGVARALCIEREMSFANSLDLNQHSYHAHWHAQLGLNL